MHAYNNGNKSLLSAFTALIVCACDPFGGSGDDATASAGEVTGNPPMTSDPTTSTNGTPTTTGASNTDPTTMGPDETTTGDETSGDTTTADPPPNHPDDIPFEGMYMMPFCPGKKGQEVYLYSDPEVKIHGNKVHYALDVEGQWGDPIFAMHDGYYASFYQITPFIREDNGEVAGYGLGLFVTAYDPLNDVYTQLGHLSVVEDWMPFHMPVDYITDEGYLAWDPEQVYVSPDDFMLLAEWVEQGEVIGAMGRSGLINGEEQEYPSPNPAIDEFTPSWDDIHVHFEVFRRVLADGVWKKTPLLRWDFINQYNGDVSALDLALVQCTGMFACDFNDPLAPLYPDCGQIPLKADRNERHQSSMMRFPRQPKVSYVDNKGRSYQVIDLPLAAPTPDPLASCEGRVVDTDLGGGVVKHEHQACCTRPGMDWCLWVTVKTTYTCDGKPCAAG